MKSTFQKPDATYPHGSLREQPEMKKPNAFPTLDERFANNAEWREYEVHLEKCRTIPCSENNWKDGQELVQDVDYVKEKIPVKSPNYFISGSKELLKAEVDENGHYFFWQAKPLAVPIVQETPKPPEWYTKSGMFDHLRNNKYSKEIAEELSEMWATLLQGSFKKGWEKGYNDFNPDKSTTNYTFFVQETEDELWKELIEFITKRFYEGWTYGEVKTETEKSFTIQRRKQ